MDYKNARRSRWQLNAIDKLKKVLPMQPAPDIFDVDTIWSVDLNYPQSMFFVIKTNQLDLTDPGDAEIVIIYDLISEIKPNKEYMMCLEETTYTLLVTIITNAAQEKKGDVMANVIPPRPVFNQIQQYLPEIHVRYVNVFSVSVDGSRNYNVSVVDQICTSLNENEKLLKSHAISKFSSEMNAVIKPSKRKWKIYWHLMDKTYYNHLLVNNRGEIFTIKGERLGNVKRRLAFTKYLDYKKKDYILTLCDEWFINPSTSD